jgi:hypothetical protein
MVLPRKVAGAATSESSMLKPLVAGPLEQYSELWAFLTRTAFEDGQRRLTGKISLSCESGLLGLLLSDSETGSYTFLNGSNLTDMLTEVEIRLDEGTVTWKTSKYPPTKRK